MSGGHPATGIGIASRRRLAAARDRYQGSSIQEIWAQLKALDFIDWTTIFGAELLWSALPFIILLSSLASERIDDDLSRHIGLDSAGAHIVRSVFRNTPSHAVEPIVTGLLFTFVGVVFVVRSLQVVYARVFELEPRGWRDLPRLVAWVGVLLGALIAEAIINQPVRTAVGPIAEGLLSFVGVTIFLAWTIHFLLAWWASWRRVIRPALATALLWVCLSTFSSLYFSTVIIADSRMYGSIGVVFTFLTWFILIGIVIVLGAAVGAVWERRRGRGGMDTRSAASAPQT